MRSREPCKFLLVAIVLPTLFAAGCQPAATPPLPPPELASPEMPGDRIAWLVAWQRRDHPGFNSHPFVFESDGLSPLATLEKLFEAAETTPRKYGKPKLVPSPQIEASEALRNSQAGKTCTVSFGVNHNHYPKFTMAEMIGHLCLDHGIALKQVSADRYVFDLAPADTRDFTKDPAYLRGQEAGLELKVKIPDKGRWIVTLTNRGEHEVVLGHPDDAAFTSILNPLMLWSVLPADEHSMWNHPSSKSIDRTIPGCGTGRVSYTGRVLALAPGKTADISRGISEPWELQSGEINGRFRTRLFFRNNPTVPFLHSHHGLLSQSKEAQIEATIAKTFDCLLVSNEVVFDATDFRAQERKAYEEYKRNRAKTTSSR